MGWASHIYLLIYGRFLFAGFYLLSFGRNHFQSKRFPQPRNMRVEAEPCFPLSLSPSPWLDTDSLINDTTFILTFAHKFYTTKLQIFDRPPPSFPSTFYTSSAHRKNLFCVKGFEFSQPFCKLAYSGREVNSTNVSRLSVESAEGKIYAS